MNGAPFKNAPYRLNYSTQLYTMRSRTGSKSDRNCRYECQSSGGCQVTYIGPSRPGKTSGSCFPQSFGGSCSGTPPECQNCNRALSCSEGGSSSSGGSSRPSGGRPSGGRPSGVRPSGGRPSGGRPSNGSSSSNGSGGKPSLLIQNNKLTCPYRAWL